MAGDDDDPLLSGHDTIEESYRELAAALDDVSSVMRGALLAGRYEVLELIGAGGMASVYRVMDIQLGEEVALKLLASGTDEETVGRFRQEVRLARRVTHPNVVRTHDIGEHRDRLFLTMELVDGEGLDRVLEREGALPPRRAATIAAQIAAGLAASHEAGVLHRDLKPSNVLVTARGRVVLTDFGIARALNPGSGSGTDEIDGTPLYMSPEQVQGMPEDPRSEIYALGLILFEMLAAAPPFSTASYAATAAERLRLPPPDPRAARPVPDALAELVLACLATDPGDRPQTAAAVGETLERWLGSDDAAPGRAPAPSTPLFAPAPSGASRSLAVLPLRYAGPAEHEYLGDGLTEELIDVLARTRSLRVLAYGATRHLRGELDAGQVQLALGGRVDAVVDGSVELAGSRLRVSIRLLGSTTGATTWAGTFDAEVGEVQDLRESMARRVAEALRVEVHGAPHLDPVPREAVELYLRAREQLRGQITSTPRPAVDLLDRCLALAPFFAPAAAAHAVACTRSWWTMSEDRQAIAARAEESVARARVAAPDMPETHLAAAVLAAERSDFEEAAASLATALGIAPTCAEAHQALGRLQAEAGRADEGGYRLRLSLELDPTLHLSRLHLAYLAALDGDHAAYLQRLAELADAGLARHTPVLGVRLRAALWLGRPDEVAEVVADAATKQSPQGLVIYQSGRYAQGAVDVADFDAFTDRAAAMIPSVRFRAIFDQTLTEVHCHRGDNRRALRALRRAAEGALVEVEWLRRCPSLEPIRTHAEFRRCAELVWARAAAIWRE